MKTVIMKLILGLIYNMQIYIKLLNSHERKFCSWNFNRKTSFQVYSLLND